MQQEQQIKCTTDKMSTKKLFWKAGKILDTDNKKRPQTHTHSQTKWKRERQTFGKQIPFVQFFFVRIL